MIVCVTVKICDACAGVSSHTHTHAHTNESEVDANRELWNDITSQNFTAVNIRRAIIIFFFFSWNELVSLCIICMCAWYTHTHINILSRVMQTTIEINVSNSIRYTFYLLHLLITPCCVCCLSFTFSYYQPFLPLPQKMRCIYKKKRN